MSLCKVLLGKNSINVDLPYERLWTPLILSVKFERSSIVKHLIEKKANLNWYDQSGTALHFACGETRLEIARLLLEAGAKVEEEAIIRRLPRATTEYKDPNRTWSPIFCAIARPLEHGHWNKVRSGSLAQSQSRDSTANAGHEVRVPG